MERADFDDLRLYRFIFDSLPVAIITVDSNLKIIGFNSRAEEITGYSAEDALGQYCGEILQGGMCKAQCPLKTVITRRRPIVRLETTILKRDGETIPVRMNTAALLDADGQLVGGVEAFQDISYLKSLERERNNFVSMIAHDMKSSLTIIGGFVLRLIKQKARIDKAKRERYLEIIRSESEKLEVMIHDFLELSRLQTGRLKLELGPTSLDKELMELFESYEIKAAEFGIQLELYSEEALPIIEGDAGRLRRVFTNLMDNALKFSNRETKISISIEEGPRDIRIRFADQGAGIDPEDLPYIFEPFHRGKVGEKVEGLGLGLAAVKAIVEGHGGEVQVESELGRGSVFTVILPKEGGSGA
jgi:two-component system phosphate regulon sensor histidine kinase PhoR